MLIKRFTGACKAADRCLSLGCVGTFQSAEWIVVKRLTDTDQVVDQALNDQQNRKLYIVVGDLITKSYPTLVTP